MDWCDVCNKGTKALSDDRRANLRDNSGMALRATPYFGDYFLIGKIAEGGMGEVWLARQESLNRRVALKLIKAGEFATPAEVQRFLIEAEAAAKLKHDNIIKIHEVGEHEGRHYFCMDLIEGGSLAGQLADHQWTITSENRRERQKTIGRLMAKVARAIHEAHQHGVLHRDLKPGNILLDTKGEPRVTDFGLAKLTGRDTGISRSGAVVGTPSYMAPEQAAGKTRQVTTATDLYGLGAVLYELLTGRRPFEAESTGEVLRMVTDQEPVPPRRINSCVDSDLETICLKCLEKDPRQRFYRSAEELAEELECWQRGEPIRARLPSLPERIVKWVRRKPANAAAIAILIGGIAGMAYMWNQAENARQLALERASRETTQRVLAEHERRRADDNLQQARMKMADFFLESDKVALGLAYLARVVRDDPSNQVAAARLVSALSYREFLLPAESPFRRTSDPTTYFTQVSADGRRVLTASGRGEAYWNLDNREELGWLTQLSSQSVSASSISGVRAYGGVIISRSPWQLSEVYGSGITAFAFAAGGDLFASANSGQAQVWDAKHFRPTKTPFNAGPSGSIQFSPDSTLLAIGGTIWRVRTGEQVSKTNTPNGLINSHQFSNDGHRLVTAGADGLVRICDTETGEITAVMRVHSETEDRPFYGVLSAQFSPDARHVVTVNEDGAVQIWDTHTGAPTVRLAAARQSRPEPGESMLAPGHLGFPFDWGAKFSPDGRWIVSAWNESAFLWNLETPALAVKSLRHKHALRSIHFSTDGRRVISGAADGSIRVWDVATGQPISEWCHHRSTSLTAARFIADGQQMVSFSHDGHVQNWDARPGAMRGLRLPHAHAIKSVELNSGGNRLLTVSGEGRARIWDLGNAAQTSELKVMDSHRLKVTRFSPDGRRVIAICEPALSKGARALTNFINVYDAVTWTRMGSPIPIEVNMGFPSISMSQDGRFLVTLSNNRTAQIWRADTGERVGAALPHTKPFAPRFSDDGSWLVTATGTKEVQVWNVQTGKRADAAIQCDGGLIGFRLSRDGRKLETACHSSQTKTVQVWNSFTGIPADDDGTSFNGDIKLVDGSAWSPNGQRVLRTLPDGSVQVFASGRNGAPVGEPMRQRTPIADARFVLQGKWIVTVSVDGFMQLWDATTAYPLSEPFLTKPFSGHFSNGSYSVSADGLTIAVLVDKRTVEIRPIVAFGSPVPSWLPAVAEMIVGTRLGDRERVEEVPLDEYFGIKARIATLKDGSPWTRWAQWYFGDRATRPFSPNASMSVSEFVKRHFAGESVSSPNDALEPNLTGWIAPPPNLRESGFERGSADSVRTFTNSSMRTMLVPSGPTSTILAYSNSTSTNLTSVTNSSRNGSPLPPTGLRVLTD